MFVKNLEETNAPSNTLLSEWGVIACVQSSSVHFLVSFRHSYIFTKKRMTKNKPFLYLSCPKSKNLLHENRTTANNSEVVLCLKLCPGMLLISAIQMC